MTYYYHCNMSFSWEFTGQYIFCISEHTFKMCPVLQNFHLFFSSLATLSSTVSFCIVLGWIICINSNINDTANLLTYSLFWLSLRQKPGISLYLQLIILIMSTQNGNFVFILYMYSFKLMDIVFLFVNGHQLECCILFYYADNILCNLICQ